MHNNIVALHTNSICTHVVGMRYRKVKVEASRIVTLSICEDSGWDLICQRLTGSSCVLLQRLKRCEEVGFAQDKPCSLPSPTVLVTSNSYDKSQPTLPAEQTRM